MAKSKEEIREESSRAREESRRKVLAVFGATIPLLKKEMEHLDVAGHDLSDQLYGQTKLQDFIKLMTNRHDWPTVKLTYFLRRDSPWYWDQMDALRDLQVKTLIRFFNLKMGIIKSVFESHKTRLPTVLSILHSEYAKINIKKKGKKTGRKPAKDSVPVDRIRRKSGWSRNDTAYSAAQDTF